MIHPGSLIRWGALGAVVLLVRAIVRESHEHRQSVILLPPSGRASGGRRRSSPRAWNPRPGWEDAEEPAGPPSAEPTKS